MTPSGRAKHWLQTMRRALAGGTDAPAAAGGGGEAPAELYRFGEGDAVAIATAEPPHPFRNILYNRVYYTIIDHAACGLARHMTRREGWINNLIENERLLYVRDDETGEYFSTTFAPVFAPCERFECVEGLNYQVTTIEARGLRVRWRIYVPAGPEDENDPVEVWDVRVADLAGRARRVSLFTCVSMKCDGVDLYAGEMGRIARYDEARRAMVVRMDAERHQTIDFPWHNGFFAAGAAPEGWDASPGAFIGPRRTLANPRAVEEGASGKSAMPMWPPLASLHVRLELAAGAEGDARDVRFLAGACDGEAMIEALRAKYLAPGMDLESDPHFEATRLTQERLTHNIQLRTPEPTIDRMARAWLKKQIQFGAYWGRWGWKGYRDAVQHAMALAPFDAALAREELLAACAHQYADGFALRGWRPVDTKRYADSAQWLIPAVTQYLKETGEMALLDEVAPYYDGGEGTVREHLERALLRLHTDRGPHGLCLAHGGDWNDSLTGVCRRGRGESVWLSMAYCRGARLMQELAEHEERVADAARYQGWHGLMARTINTHAWDGEWYLCALDDDGEPIGSARNDEGRLFLNVQTWAQLGGVANDERWASAWGAVERHLETGWGLTLNWPVYTRPHANVGRMSYIRPGAAENGMVYTHGNAFAMMALLERGQADRALRIWRDVAPGGERTPACQPNVFFNGYYGPDNEIQPGLADHAWMTGSVAWMMHALVEGMLGLRRDYDGLRVAPCLPSAWGEAEVTREFRGTTYRVRIVNPARREAAPVAKIEIDGAQHPAGAPLPMDGGAHQVLVTLAEQ